jgi:MoaA/NifB/PqqE/SkfB family radical SAM enzyme
MSKLTRDVSTAFSVLKKIVVPKVTRVAVHVTYDCNQHCKTCDIWAINKDNPELRKKEVTLKEFERFC